MGEHYLKAHFTFYSGVYISEEGLRLCMYRSGHTVIHSVCLCFGRAGIRQPMEAHTSGFEEINPVSHNDTTRSYRAFALLRAQRAGRVNKHIFCTCPDKHSILVQEVDNTFHPHLSCSTMKKTNKSHHHQKKTNNIRKKN